MPSAATAVARFSRGALAQVVASHGSSLYRNARSALSHSKAGRFLYREWTLAKLTIGLLLL